MYDTYIIETRQGAAGVVVRDGRGFRFFAATYAFSSLEGQVFDTPKQAETAAIRRAGDREPRRRQQRSRRPDLASRMSG
jgi:hypothetical protein